MLRLKNKITIVIIITIISIPFVSCKKGIAEPESSKVNALCYEKPYNNYWAIFTNNIYGSNAINISNYTGDDEYPQWSPDGRYIAFRRSISVFGPLIIVYDLQKNTYTNVTSDGGLADSGPKWTTNGKLYFAYQNPIGSTTATYIMNPDGSNKKKILDNSLSFGGAKIFFYPDSYYFLYVIDYTKVYKSNIDNTYNQFLFDFNQTFNQTINVQDFNPYTEEFLITLPITSTKNEIGLYSIKTNSFNILLHSDEVYEYALSKFSNDYSKIILIETNTVTYEEEYLSVIENRQKRRLLKFVGEDSFDFNPMQFSPDNKFIAFSKNVSQGGNSVSWKSYLYTIDITTGDLQFIDEGINPSWNSRQ